MIPRLNDRAVRGLTFCVGFRSHSKCCECFRQTTPLEGVPCLVPRGALSTSAAPDLLRRVPEAMSPLSSTMRSIDTWRLDRSSCEGITAALKRLESSAALKRPLPRARATLGRTPSPLSISVIMLLSLSNSRVPTSPCSHRTQAQAVFVAEGPKVAARRRQALAPL